MKEKDCPWGCCHKCSVYPPGSDERRLCDHNAPFIPMPTAAAVYVQTCKCGRQVKVTPRWVLPKGYDNPAHPISMYPADQVRQLILKFRWSDKKKAPSDRRE